MSLNENLQLLRYSVAELEAEKPKRYGRMRFSPDLETRFREHYSEEGVRARLWMLLVPLVLFTLAATMGAEILGVPPVLKTFTIPANWTLVACLIMGLVMVTQRPLRRYSDAAMIACGFAIAAVMTVSDILAKRAGLEVPDGLGVVYLSAMLILARMTFRRAAVSTAIALCGITAIQFYFDGVKDLVELRYLEQALVLTISGAGGWLLELNSRRLWLDLRILETISRTDPLTGIANRRGFEEAADTVMRFAMREQRPVTLMVLDLDCFKGLNDRYGHDYGDEALKRAAGFLSAQARRPIDICGRFGGEEFVIVLCNCPALAADVRCREIVQGVEALRLENAASGVSPYLTASLGAVSFYPAEGAQLNRALLKADENLYKAKGAGRNRHVFTELKAN